MLQNQPQNQPDIRTTDASNIVGFRPTTPIIDPTELERAQSVLSRIQNLFYSRIVGQRDLFLSLIVGLLANGHVLMESVPGLAKTAAATTLSDAINAKFNRIQCTPDLLPSDIIGSQIYNYTKGTFEKRLGPVHANFVLLDEINRSSAKTQSAMLEAMQERQTTIGGETDTLPHPFIVLATQNPIEQEGTYQLPEAQMDRFMLKTVIDYPTPDEELEVLNRIESGVFDTRIQQADSVNLEYIVELQKLVKKVYIDASIKNYIVTLISATRTPDKFIAPELARYVDFGSSPRGAITFLQIARVLAIINGRDFVVPDDIKLMRHSVLRHRIILNFEAIADDVHQESIIDAIFAAVKTP